MVRFLKLKNVAYNYILFGHEIIDSLGSGKVSNLKNKNW
jgi:hypothetical protein